MKKFKFVLSAAVFFLCGNFFVFSDTLSAARVCMLENQANSVGIANIDTYKRVFALHNEIYRAVLERTGICPDYFGLSFEAKKSNNYVISKTEPFRIVDYNPEGDFLFTVPVIYDYVVMVSRKSDSLEVTQNIEEKVCATFSSDIVTGDWVRDYGVRKFNRNAFIASSACQEIIEGRADIMFLPKKLAEVVFDMMMFKDELYMSRPIFEISYRFVFDSDRTEECEATNIKVVEMIENGTLQAICQNVGLLQSLRPPKNIQRRLLFCVIIFLVVALIANVVILAGLFEKRAFPHLSLFEHSEYTDLQSHTDSLDYADLPDLESVEDSDVNAAAHTDGGPEKI